VLVFDYRHFGASEGEPRQLIDVRRQHEDYAAALTYARALPWVDPDRIVLWGTSFSGGHVLSIAARDARVAAVIALVPFVDGLRVLPTVGPARALRLTREGLRDAFGALRGRPPHMIASVGPPGSVAVMTTPDAEPGFRRLIPEGADWPNEAAARIGLRVGSYRPIASVARISAPVLYCVADEDVTTPAAYALRAAERTPKAEVRRYAGAGHFDPYVPPLFDEVVADMLGFLTSRVPAPARSSGSRAWRSRRGRPPRGPRRSSGPR
jgi:pimeloyl-ACP methyl ester carboxylesterase